GSVSPPAWVAGEPVTLAAHGPKAGVREPSGAGVAGPRRRRPRLDFKEMDSADQAAPLPREAQLAHLVALHTENRQRHAAGRVSAGSRTTRVSARSKAVAMTTRA